ncbi:60S ribosomal protein L27 [Haematococcus lacustris]
MVKFLKSGCRACLQSGKVVVVLTGRFAGKKAVIVRNFDDGTTSRPYGHALVVGLQKEPRKVTKRQTAKKQAKKSSLKTFIKTINYTHLMPTRYTLAVDFKNVTTDVVDDATKKVEARKDCKKLLEEQFKTGKNRWFFTKLRF